jgi:hypothetical protein
MWSELVCLFRVLLGLCKFPECIFHFC